MVASAIKRHGSIATRQPREKGPEARSYSPPLLAALSSAAVILRRCVTLLSPLGACAAPVSGRGGRRGREVSWSRCRRVGRSLGMEDTDLWLEAAPPANQSERRADPTWKPHIPDLGADFQSVRRLGLATRWAASQTPRFGRVARRQGPATRRGTRPSRCAPSTRTRARPRAAATSLRAGAERLTSTHGCRDGELARAALVRNFRSVPEAGRGSFYPQGARALCARDVGWLPRRLNVHARVLFWRTELGSDACGSFVAARRWNGASGRGGVLVWGYGGRCLRVLCPGNAPRRPAMSVLGSGWGRVGAGVGRVVGGGRARS